MVLRKLYSHMQKNETKLLSYTIHKINSKWIKDLTVRPETIKLLEEHMGSKLPDVSLGDDFLDLTPKAKKTSKNYIKLKTFYTAKETIKKMNGRKYLQIIYLIRG